MTPINDRNLIEVKHEWGAGVFLGCIVATVGILTIVWGNVMDGFIQFKNPFCITTAEYNIALIVKGIRTPDPEIAIIGSSLSNRLDSSLFANNNVMNLSVRGGSVMTGLEVLSSAPSLPKVILVEINILDREVNEEWKNKGVAAAQSRPWVILSGVSKPLRYILTPPIFSYSPPGQRAAWRSNKRTVLRSQNAATYDIQSLVSAGRIKWDQRNSWDIANRNFKRIQELIIGFESRGAKVYLLYLPYADGYDHHAFAQRNREIASGNDAFTCQRCIDVRRLVAVEELRWKDGVHLDERSALIVAEALEKRMLPEL
jgi:hypothetical protein